MKSIQLIFILSLIILLQNCDTPEPKPKVPAPVEEKVTQRLPVIFDTDANNELDDQHAIAYLLLNQDIFDVKGITVNATYNGGEIDEHFAEAERVVKLCEMDGKIPLIKGANGDFESIESTIQEQNYDGATAIDFIIKTAKASTNQKLVFLAVGKLTNIALAVKKDPSIIKNIRLVWLGSNYPDPGEYNLENDIPAMNYLLETEIPFEMAVCRYGKPSGTDAVKVTQEEVNKNMPGLGPKIKTPITGRHDGTFDNFGDYSVSLFKYIDYYGDPPSRALFDMAAVAVVKNPEWAEAPVIPAPTMVDKKWVEQPENKRKITLWENFEKEKIITDFYQSFKK